MEKKYELVVKKYYQVMGVILYRIRALKDFSDVKKGDLGGYIEKEDNLSHEGNCWVYDSAKVFGDVVVSGNAKISDNAKLFGYGVVFDDAVVSGNARVYGNAVVYGDAIVSGNTRVYEYAKVCGNTRVFDNAEVFGNVVVSGDARLFDNARIYGNAVVGGKVVVIDNAVVSGNARISGNARVYDGAYIFKTSDYACFSSFGSENRTTTLYRTRDGHRIKCGCFVGDLKQFRKSIRLTHGDSILAKEYLVMCTLMNIRIKRWKEEGIGNYGDEV